MQPRRDLCPVREECVFQVTKSGNLAYWPGRWLVDRELTEDAGVAVPSDL